MAKKKREDVSCIYIYFFDRLFIMLHVSRDIRFGLNIIGLRVTQYFIGKNKKISILQQDSSYTLSFEGKGMKVGPREGRGSECGPYTPIFNRPRHHIAERTDVTYWTTLHTH